MKSEKFLFKILVCGGRTYDNLDNLYSILDTIDSIVENSEIKIINGGAKGADYLSRCWARKRGKYIDIYLADWETYGKKAGPIRNELMLKNSKPDLIVAFYGGKGTKNMIDLALKDGYTLEDFTKDKECQILYKPSVL